MNEVIERVAEMLWPWLKVGMVGTERLSWGDIQKGSLAHEITTDAAKAAVSVMRVPTEAMQLAGHAVRWHPDTGLSTLCGTDEIYTAMIDEIIPQPPTRIQLMSEAMCQPPHVTASDEGIYLHAGGSRILMTQQEAERLFQSLSGEFRTANDPAGAKDDVVGLRDILNTTPKIPSIDFDDDRQVRQWAIEFVAKHAITTVSPFAKAQALVDWVRDGKSPVFRGGDPVEVITTTGMKVFIPVQEWNRACGGGQLGR